MNQAEEQGTRSESAACTEGRNVSSPNVSSSKTESAGSEVSDKRGGTFNRTRTCVFPGDRVVLI